MEKAEFLNFLRNEYQEYILIPASEYREKREKKEFINGLMTASRILGVSFDELNNIVGNKPQFTFSSLDELLNVPTYVRKEKNIKF